MNTSPGSSSLSFDDEGENIDRTTLLTNRYRLWIHAGNLPRQGRLRGRAPSTYAVVTAAAADDHHHNNFDDKNKNNNEQQMVGMMTSPGIELGQTEIVKTCCNPQYTRVMDLDYEYGSKRYFFVHIFLAQQTNEDRKKVLLGSARFEAGDILGTRHHLRVRRLRNGGTVFCRLEPKMNGSITRGLASGQSEPIQYLRIRMAAKNLVWSNRNMFASLPDLIVTLSKRHITSAGKSWIVVFRSQPMYNTLNPKWDPCTINMDCLCRGDIHQQIQVSVSVVRANAAPMLLGSCQTTVRFLMEASIYQNNSNVEESQGQRPMLNLPEDYVSASTEYMSTIAADESVFILRKGTSSRTVKQVGILTVLEADIVTLDESGGIEQIICNTGVVGERTVPETVDLARMEKLEDDEEILVKPLEVLEEKPRAQEPRTKPRSFHELLIKNRCQFNFCVAIDFTSSNGDPRNDESSLHYQSDISLNDYEETILAVGQAIEGYANGDDGFSVWGFGAKFGGDGVVRDLFQCGPNPRVQGVNGILEAYRSVFHSGFTMSGPTVFLQVMQAAAVQAKRHGDEYSRQARDKKSCLRYTVLLVITDGIMNDFQETFRKLQVYKEMPLSIIFVGVGRSDFSTLSRLCSSCPENTTFVEFRSQESPSEFALGALRHLPTQVMSHVNKTNIRR